MNLDKIGANIIFLKLYWDLNYSPRFGCEYDIEIFFQIADAPNVAVNRVDTYKELDNDLLKHVAYATLDDIDLRMLTRCMAPEQALREPGNE